MTPSFVPAIVARPGGFAGGDRFIAVPDRGPNAQPYNDCIDDTTSYINRFHTLRLRLLPSSGPGLPFVLKPSLEQTTLMASSTPLSYGDGSAGCPAVPAGAPKLNKRDTFYFTGRSDNFGPGLSTNSSNARFDPESVRLSRDGKSIFVSDEYGPYIYRFDRESGLRTAVYTLPGQVRRQLPVGAGRPGDRLREQPDRARREQGHGGAGDHAGWLYARRHHAERPGAGWRRQPGPGAQPRG